MSVVARKLGVAGLLVLGAGCFEDRPRPTPFAPDDGGLVTVQLLRPFQNATVLAGRTLWIDVLARGEGGQNVSGIGYVARRVQGGMKIDSAVFAFEPRPFARDSFPLLVPAQLTTNTHLSIRALAIRVQGGVVYSPETQVVVAQEPAPGPIPTRWSRAAWN